MNSTYADFLSVGLIGVLLHIAAILVCLLAAILVFGLKLHHMVVYRLALYQVLSAKSLSIVYLLSPISSKVVQICIAFLWFEVYTRWMKLLFTMWVTFHLFCFAVLHKNLKKLEVLYILTSLFVPAVIAFAPVITHKYVDDCGVLVNGSIPTPIAIEEVELWDAPAMVILIIASIAMVIMIIKLAYTARVRAQLYKPITDDNQITKALRQLLPLAAFPILSAVFIIPQLIANFYIGYTPGSNPALILIDTVFIALWSLSSGVVLLAHIFVARYISRKMRRIYATPIPLHDKAYN